MNRGLCAFAITRAPTPDLPNVTLIEHDGLVLVVAEVSVTELSSGDDPLVRALFEHQPVLPLPSGTVLRDEAAATRLLTDHHDEASASLDRVDGHREWGVRARLPRPATPAELSPEGLSDAEYLARRRDRLAAAARTRRDALTAATALHEALSRHAAETVRQDRPSPLLDAAYLVPVDAEPAFRAEADRHEELAVEVTGPLPPYSFARL